jgi:putative aminopeptidase FrvX
MSSTALPSGENLADNAAIVIDTVPVFMDPSVNSGEALLSAADPGPGGTITFKFSEAVGNTGDVATQFTGADKFGASGTRAEAAWTDSNKTLTITLGVGETYTGDSITITDIADVAGNEITLDVSVSV